MMTDRLPGNSDDHGTVRNFLDDNGIGADPAVVADFDRAEADDHPVPDGGVALSCLCAGSPERDAVVDRNVVAHLGGLADHHTGRVVDEHTGPEECAAIDV